ncbi:hypothetical protein CORC01_00937 [Colletotrichum orchidophilum]|uniref:Uncharacterized protein n=1 Tax=Colletotrichum orchidophilum TaxID=1209926 RepID=A0A1G4BQL5_9PEZI|nr:uncharacterized protein CORC01_00937 [Colletotrichum orchidophilum]OHF03618.1 hypothetical protein CORC01_00937 [Colletotrichum orchidophilum]
MISCGWGPYPAADRIEYVEDHVNSGGLTFLSNAKRMLIMHAECCPGTLVSDIQAGGCARNPGFFSYPSQ